MINKYSFENIYNIVFILLGIFIITLSIYYIVMTMRFKHTAMVEKFVVNKEHPDDPKFRQCQIYFLNDGEINDIATCDREYKKNPETTTCKYVYDGWQERDKEVDEKNNMMTYKNKIFRNGVFDKTGFLNFTEDTRCFKELTTAIDPDSNENVHRFGSKNYLFQEFSTSDRLKIGGCDLKFHIQRTIKDMTFYKFILDNSNKITDVKRVRIKNDEQGFEIDPTFNIGMFTSGQSYGIEYLRYDNDAKRHIFNIFQISTFPPKAVDVHTFKYNYICEPNTQVIHKNQFSAQINIGSFITFPPASSGVEYSFPIALPADGGDTFKWTDFKNERMDRKEDKRALIIDKLRERKEQITAKISASLISREEALKKEWDDIQTQSGCDATCLNQFTDNNKKITDILRRIFTTNKISSYKNEFKYIKKEADMSNRVYDDIIIKVKNTFAPGLTKYVIDHTGTKWEYMVIFDDSILTEYNTSKDNAAVNDFTKLSLNKNKINYFTGYFHAPTTGNYKFRISANTSHPPQPTQFTTFSLFLNNKRELFGKVSDKPVGEGETNAISFSKGDIVKIDIYFTSHPQDITYMFGWKIASNTDYNNKSTIGRNVPIYFHKTETINSNSILTSGDGYVNGRFLMNPKIVPDETGDYYYVFKDTDLQYGIEIKKGILCDILVVGGGGGGGKFGGGGGGGGVLFGSSKVLQGSITINVGKGGFGSENKHDSGIPGSNGIKSSFVINGTEYKAEGGGGGGSRSVGYIGRPGVDGGSGGGGSHSNSGGNTDGGVTTKNSFAYTGWNTYGNNGGKGRPNVSGGNPNHASGGGGGAGGKGDDYDYSLGGGNGGLGIDFSNYFGAGVGDKGWFAGGGGGNTYWNGGRRGYGNGGEKSFGGGGHGGFDKEGTEYVGEDALHNTGGGGGGSRWDGGSNAEQDGGNGGSGIVIIRVKMTGETIVSSIDFSKQNVLA